MRILITGTSRGLGLVLAQELAAAGHHVVGCARSTGGFTHDRYHHLTADVTVEADVARVMRDIRGTVGGLDAVINNAGWGRMLPVALTPADVAEKIMRTNFTSTFLVTRAALRVLRQSRDARIVNVSSVAAPLRLEGEAVYAASKAAVEMLTRITAKEVGPWGITCNAVAPTPIRTQLIDGVPEDKLQALIDRQAIPRWAEPRDVVNVVEFFLRPESRMVTGQVLYLGGLG